MGTKRRFDSSLRDAALPSLRASQPPLPSQANVHDVMKCNLCRNGALLLLQVDDADAKRFRSVIDRLHIIGHLLL